MKREVYIHSSQLAIWERSQSSLVCTQWAWGATVEPPNTAPLLLPSQYCPSAAPLPILPVAKLIKNLSEQCQECNKVFNCKSNLRRHIRGIHLRLRPFPCTLCGKCFERGDHLREHLVKKHQVDNYTGWNIRGLLAMLLNYASFKIVILPELVHW